LGNFTIYEPILIPLFIAAAIIGIVGFIKTRQLSTRGHIVYSISFLMYAFMMTSAMILHCFIYIPQGPLSLLTIVFSTIDAGLTSSIAISFFFNGLIDIGALKENTKTYMLMFTSYTAVFIAWLFAFIYNNQILTLILYFGVIAVACSFYIIFQIIKLIQRKSLKGFGWLFIAGITGGIGFICVFYGPVSLWLCLEFGNYFGPEFWWCAFSDIAVIGLEMYFSTSTKVSDYFNYTYEPLTVIA